MKNLIIFGIQGSGKGTQAERLREKYNGVILGTGNIFRELATKETPIAVKVREILNAGNLVDDELVAELVFEEYKILSEKSECIIWDGFPRRMSQVALFEQLMKESDAEYRALYLVLSKEDAITRIASRFEKEGRADDGERAVLERRFTTFFEETFPVVDYFRQQGRLEFIDGNQSIDEVTEEIDESIASFFAT